MAEAALSGNAPGDALVSVRGLVKHFDVSATLLNRLLEGGEKQFVKAVDGVSFDIPRGKTFSVVGESGCGKSTVARLLAGIYTPTEGSISFQGTDIASLKTRKQMAPLRRRLQMIFQDPYASLNPRWRVRDIVAEPIRFHRLLDDDAAIERTRTRAPAVSGSASPSRARSRPSRSSWSATSRPRRSTSRCRRRSST